MTSHLDVPTPPKIALNKESRLWQFFFSRATWTLLDDKQIMGRCQKKWKRDKTESLDEGEGMYCIPPDRYKIRHN